MRNPRLAWLLACVPVLMAVDCNAPPDPCMHADMDGDGADSIDCGGYDCDDNDPQRLPGVPEICDPLDKDEDCDPNTFGERDADGDSFFDAQCCNEYDGVPICGDDCNDFNPSVHPISNESCNEVDDDCDGISDEGVSLQLYTDVDEDGYGAGAPFYGCFLEPGVSYLPNDCDDTAPALVPGSIRCVDSTSYEMCVDGLWEKPALCGAAQYCHAQPNETGICL